MSTMRKWSFARVLFLLFILLLLPPSLIFAREIRQGNECLVEENEVVEGNLFALCEDLIIDGTVNGSVLGAALHAEINGDVNGSIYLASSQLTINGSVTGDVHFGGIALNWNVAADPDADEAVGRAATSNLIALDISTTITKDAFLSGSIINLGYQLIVNGTVRDEVNFWGSTFNVTGAITSDVYAHVGDSSAASNSVSTLLLPFNLDIVLAEPGLNVDAEASVTGNLQYESPSTGVIAGEVDGQTIYIAAQPVPLPNLEEPGSLSLFARSAIQEGAALFITGALCLLLFPQSLHVPLQHMRYHAFGSVSVGLLSFIISFPVILIMTFLSFLLIVLLLWIGLQSVATVATLTLSILLIGGALIFYLTAIFVARALFALALGRLLLRLLWARDDTNINAYMALFVGTICLSIIVTLPVVGWVANALALFLGLGGILHVLLERIRYMRGDVPDVDQDDPVPDGPTISVESSSDEDRPATETQRPQIEPKAATQPRKLDGPPAPGMNDLPEGFDMGFFEDE